MASKGKYPQGVVVSNKPCNGPASSRKGGVGTCPSNRLLKQKIVDKGGDQCYECYGIDHPHMNAGRWDGPKEDRPPLVGGSGKIGSKGSPPKKGSKNKKTRSASK